MEPNESTPIQKKNTLALILAAILIAALLAGGSVYVYEHSKQTKQNQDLQAQIDTLKSQVANTNATPTPSAMPVASPTSKAVLNLTATQLMNTTYQNSSHKPVKLINGTANFVFDSGTGKDGTPYSVEGSLSSDGTAFGDLDGDGVPDAAVILAENAGGTGYFYSIAAVINKGGQPVIVAYGATDLGDRPDIKSITIKDGIITVNALVVGSNDAFSNPTQPKTFNYKLVDGKLISQ